MTFEQVLREKPKTMEQLEKVRGMYLERIEKASESELKELYMFFIAKRDEADAIVRLLKENVGRYPKVITRELISSREKVLLLWVGLMEEVDKRLV